MLPENKASAKSTKKGKAPKKRSIHTASVNSESDWTSGGEEEETSVKALLSNMITMMATPNTHMNEM